MDVGGSNGISFRIVLRVYYISRMSTEPSSAASERAKCHTDHRGLCCISTNCYLYSRSNYGRSTRVACTRYFTCDSVAHDVLLTTRSGERPRLAVHLYASCARVYDSSRRIIYTYRKQTNYNDKIIDLISFLNGPLTRSDGLFEACIIPSGIVIFTATTIISSASVSMYNIYTKEISCE